MASNVSDKLVWTTLIISGIAACWYLPYVLRQVKESATISIPPPKANKPQLEKDAEAAIKPSTLAELADGPSYNLAASAIRLTTAKFLKSDAKKFLLRDLASTDHERREQAINALRLLLTNTAFKDYNVKPHFNNEATFKALVTALVNLLPEHQKASSSTSPPTSPIRPKYRSPHEAALLSFVGILINEPRKDGTPENKYYVRDAQLAVNAGIIPRWLKHYPFPCTLPKNRRWNFKRQDVCRLLDDDVWGSDDEPMSTLVNMLLKLPDALLQFSDVGLLKSGSHKTNDGRRPYWRYSFDVTMPTQASDNVNQQQIYVHPDLDLTQRIGEEEARRLSQQVRGGRTAGERSLRRRHRQAVVVAEAGMPLSEENILQRQPTETELNWEEEITSRQGELLREMRRDENRHRSVVGGDEDLDQAVDQLARERIDGLEVGVSGPVWDGPVPPDFEWPQWRSDAWSLDDDDNDDDDEDEDEDEDEDNIDAVMDESIPEVE